MNCLQVQAGNRLADLGTTGAVSQASTNAYATVTGADLDAGAFRSVSYTISVITNAVTWQVLGANSADYSDAVVVQAGASVAAGANSSYSVQQAPFRYYRVQIEDTAAGSHGTATVNGVCKP
jgi:hypothetical protein